MLAEGSHSDEFCEVITSVSEEHFISLCADNRNTDTHRQTLGYH